MRTLSVVLNAYLSGIASRDEDEIENREGEPDRPGLSVIVEAMITTHPSHPHGLVHPGPGRSGRTILDSIRTPASSGTTAIQRYFAHFSERSCTGPSVLSVRYVAP